MSYRSPFVNVIGSPSSLEALVFIHGPIHSVPCARFSCVDVVLAFTPSVMYFVPCPMVNSRPLSSCVMVALVAGATAALPTALVYSAMTFATSREALTSSANCSLCFYCASSLVASFYFCITISSRATISGARHSGGHESSTTKTTSSIAMKGSLV